MNQVSNLLQINKKALFDKLDKVQRTKLKYLRCDDIIEALSEAKIRDKRLINDYTEEEVVVKKVIVLNGTLKKCRFFTPKGIARYLAEGKLYNAKNACEYFSVEYVSKESKELAKLCSGTFEKKKLFKWLFEKRKSIKEVPDELSKDQVIEWLESYDADDIIDDKKERLLKYLKA